MKDVERIAFWGKIVGVVISVYGIVVVIQGLLTSIVGAIPGVLAILVGSFIFSTAEHAKKYIGSKGKLSPEIHELLKFIGKSFLFLGIIVCIFILSYGIYVIAEW